LTASGAEVDRAVGDRPRCKGCREPGEGGCHPLHEFIAAVLLEQQPRVCPIEGLDHHQLRTKQPNALDVQRRGALDLRRL
jgi:hypothetical protein